MINRIGLIVGTVAFSVLSLEARVASNSLRESRTNYKHLNKRADIKKKPPQKKKVAPTPINQRDVLSVAALKQEKTWKEAEENRNELNKQITAISEAVNKHNEALSRNIDSLMNNSKKCGSDTVVVSHYSEEANKKYREITNQKNELATLKNKVESFKTVQNRIAKEIDELKPKIHEHNEEKITDKLVKDNVACIIQKADNVIDLVRLISAEVESGALKSLPKCKSNVPHVYPVEAISSDRKVTCPFDLKYQLVDMVVEARPTALVFSPCSGTVVFCEKLKKLGNTIVIHNSECLVVISGLKKALYSMGHVVSQGQIIGELCEAQGKKDYATMRYVIRTKLDKKWIENK